MIGKKKSLRIDYFNNLIALHNNPHFCFLKCAHSLYMLPDSLVNGRSNYDRIDSYGQRKCANCSIFVSVQSHTQVFLLVYQSSILCYVNKDVIQLQYFIIPRNNMTVSLSH